MNKYKKLFITSPLNTFELSSIICGKEKKIFGLAPLPFQFSPLLLCSIFSILSCLAVSEKHNLSLNELTLMNSLMACCQSKWNTIRNMCRVDDDPLGVLGYEIRMIVWVDVQQALQPYYGRQTVLCKSFQTPPEILYSLFSLQKAKFSFQVVLINTSPGFLKVSLKFLVKLWIHFLSLYLSSVQRVLKTIEK